MPGWEDYKTAIQEAEGQYHRETEEAWKWHQSEIANILANPKMNPEMGRVSMARAIARFWSRTEKIGMNLAGSEQAAFDTHIKPLRQQAQQPPERE